MEINYKKMGRIARQIDNEKKFVVDWKYLISKPVKCEVCGRIIQNGVYIRAWFEIGREVYPEGVGGKRKGITICNEHNKTCIIGFLRKFYAKKVNHNRRLQGCVKWDVRNAYDNHNINVLKKIASYDIDAFRNYVVNINKRYAKRFNSKLNIDRTKINKIEQIYEEAISDHEFKNLSDNEFKKRLDEIDEFLITELGKKKINYNKKSLANYARRLGEYIQNISVARFLYKGEISNRSYFRKRLVKYASKWNVNKLMYSTKQKKNKNKRIRKKDELKYKVAVASELSAELIDKSNKLSAMLEDIKCLMEKK